MSIMRLSRLSVHSLTVLTLALFLRVPSADAQSGNACAVALRQELQTITQSRSQLNDAYIDLQAQYSVAVTNCPSGSANQQCVAQAEQDFVARRKILDDQGTLLNAAGARAYNDFSGANCIWTPQQITQMVATLGQVTAQITQSVAQVIAAAKGNGSAAGKAAQPGSGATRSGGRTAPTAPPA
jgi:hypothetical protein